MRPVGAAVPPLDAEAVARAVVRPGGLWRQVEITAETASTNTDLLAAAAAGAAEGTVLAAETQTAGRGRMGRRWHSPPGSALAFSVLLRPVAVPANRRGWVPLLAGVAAASALREAAGVAAVVKWPNDVLVGDRKLAGVLAEQAGEAIVVGIGINVSAHPPGIAGARATSVAAAGGAQVSRAGLLVAVLGEVERWYLRWRADPDGCGLRQRYLELSGTIGRTVRVELPGGRWLTGTAADIDSHGRLVLAAAATLTAVSAGDVVHIR